jgi:hypothetical protein
VVCGVTCHRAQRQQHVIVAQLYKSDAPLVRVVEPTEYESSRAISSDLVGLCQRGPIPSTQGGDDSGRGCLVNSKYVVAPMVACRGVCEEIRVRDDAVQPGGSSTRDVANIVGW